MYRRSGHRAGQSFLEYVMLLAVISAAIIAMYTYMQRSVNARLKQVQIELDETRR